jgi:sulfate transport system permease protein
MTTPERAGVAPAAAHVAGRRDAAASGPSILARAFGLRPSALPGFGPAMGVTLLYLSLIVLIPLAMVAWKTEALGWARFWSTVLTDRALAAYALSFGASLAAALVNVVFGVLCAWVLVRYRFPGRGLVDALVDLPFALPTAVGGIALTGVYSSRGVVGSALARLGVEAAFTRLGVVVALTFVGLPFVVRTVEPVLEDLDAAEEEAAATLGASRLYAFRRVILPAILPAAVTGGTLAFARALGEYGSVVFISGNMPYRTEIVPLLIMTKLEQYDYAGANAIAIVMLVASFALLLVVNRLQAWSGRRVSV